MMRTLLAALLLALLLASLAAAQSTPSFGRSQVITGLDGLQQDVMGQADFGAALATKQDFNGDALGQHVTPADSLSQQATVGLFSPTFLSPDWFKLPTDGDDDAPSIQRAITSACAAGVGDLQFLARHYTVNSPIAQECSVNWRGRGWQSLPAAGPGFAGCGVGSAASLAGTWLDIGVSLATVPAVTFNNVKGAIVEGFGVSEPGQPAPPTTVLDANGHIIGWSPAAWAPAAYLPVFTLSNGYDVTFRHMLFDGVNAGILSVGASRVNIFDIRGQAFLYLMNIQSNHDVSRFVDVHSWPFWSCSDPVLQWDQENAYTLLSYNVDTPFFDRVFSAAMRAGIYFTSENSGITTGFSAGTISCDFSLTCLWFDATPPTLSVQYTGQIANLRSFGQKWDNIYGHSPIMLPGSTTMRVDGSAVLQLGNIEDFGSDLATVQFTNATANSNVEVGSAKVNRPNQSVGAVFASFPLAGSSGGSLLTLSMPLLGAGPPPAGWRQSNTGLNGPGIGILQWPIPVLQN